MTEIERFEFDRQYQNLMDMPPPGIAICEQPNGERLRMERWAFEAARNGTTSDPVLLRTVNNAVKIRIGW